MARKIIKGIPASPGISLGNIFIYEDVKLNINEFSTLGLENEKNRLLSGREKSKLQLMQVRDKALITLGKDKADIFDGHIALLEDEELFDDILEKIKKNNYTAEYALEQGIEEYANMLSNLKDEYFRERATDLRDIGRRWIYNISDTNIVDLSNLPENTIIVAKDLTPSDTAQLDLKNVLAFVTEIGGRTSHSSIMARSLELPAVVGVGNIIDKISKSKIIVDAINGEVILDPTVEDLEKYSKERDDFLKEKEFLKQLRDKKAISLDGSTVNLCCNIGSPNDVDGVIANGGDGIGLYRTEFLFMDKDTFPTEEEQFKAYKIVAEKLNGKPVTIRTMDIGGDKSLPYMQLPKEDNPFLGWRAIRICLDRKEILKTQFRALLRASHFGYIKIMLPMIMDVEEIRKSRMLLEECKIELKSEGIEFDENIALGIMVETPAVAFRAKYFAKECDFFSIGTNDLTQYTLAVDRGNENISNLYDTYNPAVLQAIKMSIDGAHEAGIPISMCGEFAGDEEATALLFGMGLDSFSMSAISISRVKRKILNLEKSEAEKLVSKVLTLATSKEVKEVLQNFNNN